MNAQNVDNLIQTAENLLLQAELAPAESREEIVHEAKDALILAEKVSPGSGSWLMACIHARTKNGEMCVKWMERARKAGTLPDRAAIEASPYFAGVQDEDWLKNFLESIG